MSNLKKIPSWNNLKSRTEDNLNRAAVLIFCVAAILAAPVKSHAQDDKNYFTLNAGGGWTDAAGMAGKTLDGGWKNFSAGAGFSPTHPDRPDKWSFFIDVNFLFDQLAIKQSAIQQAAILNPTNIALLEANSGRAKFYTTSVDPTLRFPLGSKAEVYVLGGFGWFRRTLEFTGASTQGALLQPSSPVVFGNGGNSGAYDAGGGLNFRLPGRTHLMLYGEVRVVHGLAINGSTTLVPISAGIRW